MLDLRAVSSLESRTTRSRRAWVSSEVAVLVCVDALLRYAAVPAVAPSAPTSAATVIDAASGMNFGHWAPRSAGAIGGSPVGSAFGGSIVVSMAARSMVIASDDTSIGG